MDLIDRLRKYVGPFDEQKREYREPIEDMNELYKFADRLHATVASYDAEKVRGT